jgi:putative hydrolase of the HAD superfamily
MREDHRISVIAFDGDDTLWHNESIFTVVQERFVELLSPYVDAGELGRRLLENERRNLDVFGYGVKSFVLSMIETAIDVSGGGVEAERIQRIIDAGKFMLQHPVELLEGVEDAIQRLKDHYRLMVITKGDLFHQESKLVASGLEGHFWKVVIVSEKDERTYGRILQSNDIRPDEFLMVGNSIKSDVLPVLALGGGAVHVPYHTTWELERVELPVEERDRFHTLTSLTELPALVERLVAGS